MANESFVYNVYQIILCNDEKHHRKLASKLNILSINDNLKNVIKKGYDDGLYDHVCRINIDVSIDDNGLGEVFRLGNSNDAKDGQITRLTDRCASISVGDIIEDYNGVLYAVLPTSFAKI